MEVSLQLLLEEMLEKTKAMTEAKKELESRLKESEEKVTTLSYDLKAALAEAENLRNERDFLLVSRRLADTPDSLVETRRHIARLIRCLDSSINLLEKDPAL